MTKQKPYAGWSIIVDCDGCLTDGKKYVDSTGQRQMIAFHSRDSIACKALIEMGFQVIVLTHSNFTGIDVYWMKYGAKVCTVTGGDPMTNKLDVNSFVSTPINWEKTIGIGDDVTDICYLEKCKFAFCPDDSHTLLKSGILLNEKDRKILMLKQIGVNGGQGVLSEILYLIQSNQINAND